MSHHRLQARTELTIVPPQVEEGAVVACEWEDAAARSELLTNLLEEPDTARIALYIPEEWLPVDSQPRYREAYLDAWWQTLGHIDYRGDFVDGDIGEIDSVEPVPQLAKAAHLAPMLGRAGLITASDVAYITSGTNSDVLRASFADISRPARAISQATLHDVPTLLMAVNQAADEPGITDARSRWLRESGMQAIAREVARSTDWQTAERLLHASSGLERQIALRALALHGRTGSSRLTTVLPGILRQRQHDDIQVRRQADVSLRHLYNSGALPEGTLEAEGMDLPQLAGNLSANLRFMPEEVALARAAARRIGQQEDLGRLLYPIAMLGGSRLKGYGDESADTDIAVVARPDAVLPDTLPELLFDGLTPTILQTSEMPQGLYIDPVWSNLLFNAVWIGDKATVSELQRATITMYDTPIDRYVALRRLEQDVLQYRLLHKGYERHYPVRADDTLIVPDGIDGQSTFWDSGYRRLATQLFAEKVRLPTIPN